MQVYVFVFPMNSAGMTAIVLPPDFPSGIRTLRLAPPSAHAWTFQSNAGVQRALNMDQELPLGPGSFQAGETIGAAQLDSGSGNGSGVAS